MRCIMAKRKFSSNYSGCGTLIVGILLLLGMIYAIISAALNAIPNVFSGAVKCFPFIIIIIIACIVWNAIFFVTHRKPLTYEQAHALARGNVQKYIKRKYLFKKGPVTVNPVFKSNLNVTGRWYEIEEPIDTFPAYVAALLEGKYHEWVVIAIEKNGLVCNMWVNKGADNQNVSFNCDINDIVQKCRQVGGYTVLRFHNHPNPDPRHYTTLLASEQDKISARSCAEYICREGFNWYDFICARGKFIQFFAQISDSFELPGESTSDIIDKIGICPEMDYELQKQYRKVVGANSVIKRKPVVITTLTAIVALLYFVGKGTDPVLDSLKSNDNKTAESIANISEEAFYNPSQAYIEEILNKIPGVLEIETATSSTDVNDLLGDECSSVVFFTYEKVDQTSFKDDKTTPTAKGTDGGGCIEVFFKIEDAKSRMTRLEMMKLLAGGSYRYGTVIIRTSSKLSLFEQNELEVLILEQMVETPPDGAAVNENKSQATHSADWVTAELEDFEYDFQNDGIILEEYKGSLTSVIIPASYEVEGTTLPVLKLDDTFKKNEQVENVIISEGVTDLTSDVFYECNNLKHVYIPVSVMYMRNAIKDVSGEILYYGGTEDQWNEINLASWSDIAFKRVVFNSTVEDCYANKDKLVEDAPKDTESGCVPLSDFGYDLTSEGIVLTDYRGRDKIIKIAAFYYVNGIEHPVVKLDTTFALSSVDAVCVPEGVKALDQATFNSCGIKKLYLPATLTDVPGSFWGYFHDLNTLYYGGTEDEFQNLLGTTRDRWDLDVKHVEYKASPDDVFD